MRHGPRGTKEVISNFLRSEGSAVEVIRGGGKGTRWIFKRLQLELLLQ